MIDERNIEPVEIGRYIAGAIPPPLVATFLDFNGDNPVDLSDFTEAEFHIVNLGVEDEVVVPAVITGPLAGEVTHTWVSDHMDEPGRYNGIFWIGNGGSTRLHSVRYGWWVDPGIGTVPSI